MATIELDEDTLRCLQRYADQRVEREQTGGSSTMKGSLKDWEDARSYAVDVATAILYGNPGLCEYTTRINKIREARKSSK